MYQHHFGLQSAPFRQSTDTRFLFLSESHREAIAQLIYALNESGGFALLTGAPGLGKTTLFRYVLDFLPDNVQLITPVNPAMKPSELLTMLTEELGALCPEGTPVYRLLNVIDRRLETLYSEGKRVMLVIDEAHHLPDGSLEILRLLNNLETLDADGHPRKLLRMTLLGQDTLAYRFEQADLAPLAQRLTGRYHLTPMSNEETAAYVQHRLSVAGSGRTLFTPQALNLAHKLTFGSPRLLNTLCDRALLGAYAEDAYEVDATIIANAAREAHLITNVVPFPRRNDRIARPALQTSPQAAPRLAWLTESHVAQAATGLLVATALTWSAMSLQVPERIEQAFQQHLAPTVESWHTRLIQTVQSSSPPAADSHPAVLDTGEGSDLAAQETQGNADSFKAQYDLQFRLGIPTR